MIASAEVGVLPTCEQVGKGVAVSVLDRDFSAPAGCPVMEECFHRRRPTRLLLAHPTVWCPRRLLKVDLVGRACGEDLCRALESGGWSPRHSLEPQVCLCVCALKGLSRVSVGCGGFWLNNLRTLFSNCGRALFFFFFSLVMI